MRQSCLLADNAKLLPRQEDVFSHECLPSLSALQTRLCLKAKARQDASKSAVALWSLRSGERQGGYGDVCWNAGIKSYI